MIREIILLISISVIGQIVLFYISLETHFHIRGKKRRLKHFQKNFQIKRKKNTFIIHWGEKSMENNFFFVKFVFKGEEKYFPKATLPQLDLIALWPEQDLVGTPNFRGRGW